MSLYVDANVLIRLYLNLDAVEIRRTLCNEASSLQWPLPVTDLLACEIRNGIERMVFESHRGGQWRVSKEIAHVGQAVFDDELNAGLFLSRVPASVGDISAEFDRLALRHTAKHGFRTYDIMHVASALHLGCTQFFSFDNKAKDLARLEGLQTI